MLREVEKKATLGRSTVFSSMNIEYSQMSARLRCESVGHFCSATADWMTSGRISVLTASTARTGRYFDTFF